MTIQTWLTQAEKQLHVLGVATGRLDCLVLLGDATNKDRSYLLAHSEEKIANPILKKLREQIKRRANHEPLAYIRGKTEFYGREFLVTPDTLEPRPETETMIDLVKSLKLPKDARIADVGAGSGAIGITLALELPESRVDMYEISRSAASIAQKNIKRYELANCVVHQNDLLSGRTVDYDLVVANLPYVPDSHTINQAAMQEPEIAIFGGPDGLDVYRKLFLQLSELQPRFIVTECLPFQHKQLTKIARSAGFHLQATDDFIQNFIR